MGAGGERPRALAFLSLSGGPPAPDKSPPRPRGLALGAKPTLRGRLPMKRAAFFVLLALGMLLSSCNTPAPGENIVVNGNGHACELTW